MGFTFDSGGIFGSCFTYLIAGVIAGTVASFVVRGRLGCVVVNFGLGILGAIVANLLLNLISPALPASWRSTGFYGIIVFASIAATLVSYIFNSVMKAERRQQQQLLDKHRDDPRFQDPGAAQ